jgi:hypothetical protein
MRLSPIERANVEVLRPRNPPALLVSAHDEAMT